VKWIVTVKYAVEADTMQAAMQARPTSGGLMSAREASKREFDDRKENDG
jgi:hypothetical protein